MAHFNILTNEDGSVAQILRDGEPYDQAVNLEPPHQIVSAYFKIARTNLDAMATAIHSEEKRALGLQSFVMSLTGIEAFTNVFFHVLSKERQDAKLAKANSRQGPLIPRLEKCLELAFDQPLPDQEMLLSRIRDLYRFRNQIVHPRWEPESMWMDGLLIDGLCQNFQLTCEDQAFCEEAFWRCVALIAEIGKANGSKSIEAPCFYWAGLYMLTEDALAEKLGG